MGAGYISASGDLPHRGKALEIGKGRIVKEGLKNRKYTATIVSLGTRMVDSILAARTIEAKNPDVSVTVADARFMKPFDEGMLRSLASSSDLLLTIEEGSKGGFGDHVLSFLSNEGLMDSGSLRVRSMCIPDKWIEAGPQKDQYDIAGLNEPHIVSKVEETIRKIRDHKQTTRREAVGEGAIIGGASMRAMAMDKEL